MKSSLFIFITFLVLLTFAANQAIGVDKQTQVSHLTEFNGIDNPLGTGDLIFKYETGIICHSSPAIGNDGTIYICGYHNGLFAINPDGTLKWNYRIDDEPDGLIDSSPVIGSDGTIYFSVGGTLYNNLFAINPDGTLKWKHSVGRTRVLFSPAIGPDGTIYVGDQDKNLNAINPDGTFKWKYFVHEDCSMNTPVIGNDGTIYIGSHSRLLHAINPNGTLKWEYPVVNNTNTPAIGKDGTIYFSNQFGIIYAINPDGTLKWEISIDGELQWSSLVIDSQEIIYVGTSEGIYAINPDGTLKWYYQFIGPIQSTPAIGSDGTIYFASLDHYLYAINPDGTLKWKYQTENPIYSSPVISNEGTIYFGLYNGLYAIDTGTNSGLADSPWPKFQRDIKNSGNAYTGEHQPYLYLSSPNGGESWEVNSTKYITWTSSGINDVKLEYSTNNGTHWTEIVDSTPASEGSYSWLVPNINSNECLIKIHDNFDTDIFDVSNSKFSITELTLPQTIDIISPESELSGNSFWIDIKARDVQNQFGVSFVLNYTNGEYIEEIFIEAGEFLGDDILYYSEVNKETSKVSVGLSRKSGQENVNGSGVLARIQFTTNSNTPHGTLVKFSLSEIDAIDKDGTSLSLESVSDAILITRITLNIPVWPGDTNNDGLVDQADVLPLGLYWALEGPTRPEGSYIWEAQICQSWYPEEATHADAKGDGIVNQADILPIGLNWNRTHSMQKIVAISSLNSSGTIKPFFLIELPINAGEEFWIDIMVDDVSPLLGISFVLTYDNNELIEPVSAESGVFMGEDIVFFSNINKETDEVAVGITRKAGQGNISGSGTVAKIKLKMTQNFENGSVITFFLNNVLANNQSGEVINLTVEDGQISVGVSDELSTLPRKFLLSQNYPNPFNPLTSIEFAIPVGKSEHVRLNIYDLRGALVRTLVNELRGPGIHSAMWDGTDETGKKVSSGVYIYQLRTSEFTKSHKMLLIR